MADALAGWDDFNVAMAGASAALAGLVIVAASVNIDKIIRAGTLTARLGAAIASLVLALVASAVALVPGIDRLWYGIVVVLCTVAAGIFQVHATRVVVNDPEQEQRARLAKSVLGFLPVAAYLAAGIVLLLGSTNGLVLAAAGCLLAIVSAIVVSWVVLVEVLRRGGGCVGRPFDRLRDRGGSGSERGGSGAGEPIAEPVEARGGVLDPSTGSGSERGGSGSERGGPGSERAGPVDEQDHSHYRECAVKFSQAFMRSILHPGGCHATAVCNRLRRVRAHEQDERAHDTAATRRRRTQEQTMGE